MSDGGPPPGSAAGGRGAAPLRLFVVAGEHSGDHLGAGLIRALRARVPGLDVAGVGGAEMAAEGLEPLFPLADIAVMGFVPVLARLPRILRRIRETAAAAAAARPDVLVIVDSPDFTHRVARRVRALAPEVPVVDYVSPSVWAWRPGRAPAMRAYVDHVLALLPFEPAAHLRLGGPPCTYVGHPLIERLGELRPSPAEVEARKRPTLLVLPGSRASEIRRLTAMFGEAVALVAGRVPGLDVVLPAVADLEAEIRERVAGWAVRPRIVTGEAAKLAAFRGARAALAASGTVTLELALSGVPMAVAYRVSPFETWLRHVVTVSSIVLPNLVLGENAIPEFLQGAATPDALAQALVPLLAGEGLPGGAPARAAQLAAFGRLDAAMRIAPGSSPSAEAARVVLAAARAAGHA